MMEMALVITLLLTGAIIWAAESAARGRRW
jgi:hypothetical protein